MLLTRVPNTRYDAWLFLLLVKQFQPKKTFSSTAPNYTKGQLFLSFENFKLRSKYFMRKFGPYNNESTPKIMLLSKSWYKIGGILPNHSFSNCQKWVKNDINCRNNKFTTILKKKFDLRTTKFKFHYFLIPMSWPQNSLCYITLMKEISNSWQLLQI